VAHATLSDERFDGVALEAVTRLEHRGRAA
jgi:hypothetical protein